MTQNQKPSKAICRFEKTKQPLTVGDVFEMHCEWPSHLAVLSVPIRIEFQNPSLSTIHNEPDNTLKKDMTPENTPLPQVKTKPSPYSLTILKTKSVLPGKATFKVTSYQPGIYNTGFHILSDKGVVEVQPLSWKVESVLPKGKQVQPYPPYGPWMEPLPFWYWPVGVFILISCLIFLALKIRFFMRRKNKIKEVKARLKQKQAYQEFISQLNLLIWKIHKHNGSTIKTTSALEQKTNQNDVKEDKQKAQTDPYKQKEQKTNQHYIITEVEQAFRLFLENEFFIYALKETPIKIVQQLKKYYPFVHQKHKKKILDFFAELNRLSHQKAQPEDLEQIIDMARQVTRDLVNYTDRVS